MTSIAASTPMELLGASPGVSIIDPSTVLTRLWYFDGKFLRADGFRMDQQYVRGLNALSNQAVGHGVVHGYDVALAAGDVLRVEGGLALAPSGRVVYLPSQVDLTISTLIDRSTGVFDPGAHEAAGVAAFEPCPPDSPADPVDTVTPRPLYVLTVAAAEALCGEEERFGQLCEDACASETDRSVAVEGVRFRVRELDLTLPTSTLAMTDRHLRSCVAHAFFERERRAVPSMISGAGIRSTIWCHGAPGIGGEEVELAVFDRSGAVTSWVDLWIARRELMETTPQRYWGWRLAQRPLDVFLAQVLQFQCQLAGSGTGGGDEEIDPCADERALLSEVLAELTGGKTGEFRPGDVVGERVAESIEIGARARELDQLRLRIVQTLNQHSLSPSGSILYDRGHCYLPSAGYLPTNGQLPVEPQVRALMGRGVDVRFCTVREDFIPEAFLEAQHMERISLTQGIDDPDRREEVDVLVPGGTIAREEIELEAFEGRLRFLPREKGDEAGARITLDAVARDQVQDGWSWSLAAFGEINRETDFTNLGGQVFEKFDVRESADVEAARAARERAREAAREAAAAADEAAAAEAERLAAEADAAAERVAEEMRFAAFEVDGQPEFTVADASLKQRIRSERWHARERADRWALAFDPQVRAEVPPDRGIPEGSDRPLALWFDMEVDRDLREVDIGGSTPFRTRLSVYSRARDTPLVLDVQITGSLVVTRRQAQQLPSVQAVKVSTTLSGFGDPLIIVGGQVRDDPPQSIQGIELDWIVATSATQAGRMLEVTWGSDNVAVVGAFKDVGSPRSVRGAVELVLQLAGLVETHRVAQSQRARLFDVELDESPGALDPGNTARDLGEAVIDVIGTELAIRGRDPAFAPHARRRLFEADERGAARITSKHDWVMFHRRRTKDCGDAGALPLGLRRFRWFHARRDRAADLKEFAVLSGSFHQSDDAGGMAKARARLDRLGFEPVGELMFQEGRTELHSSVVELRNAWQDRQRGSALAAGVVATAGVGDGANVELGRLLNATAAVAGLVDTTRMQTHVLPEIPFEFQSDGVHGVLLTLGVGAAADDVELDGVVLEQPSFGTIIR